jgi:hypothetical protein
MNINIIKTSIDVSIILSSIFLLFTAVSPFSLE